MLPPLDEEMTELTLNQQFAIRAVADLIPTLTREQLEQWLLEVMTLAERRQAVIRFLTKRRA